VRWLVVAAALLAAGVWAAEAPPVTVQARVEPEHPAIGQPFRYVLDVVARPGVEVVVAQPSERLGDFDILDFGVEPVAQRDGRSVVTRWWKLVGWSPGEHLIESPAVRYRLPGEDLRDAEGDPTRVVIPSVLGEAGERAELRDIKGPEPVPRDLRPWYVAAAALAALLAAILVWRWLRARRRRGAVPVATRPPHEIAADALRTLRARRLPEAGEWKEFYSVLSGIVRRYLEDRFQVRAPEMTTEEFLTATARGGALERTHRVLLGEVLAESDLVKFARHVPALRDADRAFTAAEHFVDETAPHDRLPEEGTRAAG
jgi:hypothetical protein